MREPKSFDCVEMKNAIQAQLIEEQEGLTDAEIAKRRSEWLESSDSPVAQWWRSVRAAQEHRIRSSNAGPS